MNLYETVKADVPVRQATEHYRLSISRNDMACCPFHNDKHPSLKLNEDYFYCFGCGAKGDIVDFTARLYDLTSYEAAQQVAAHFGLSADSSPPVIKQTNTVPYHKTQSFKEQERLCFSVLVDYLWLLREWKVRYAPKIPEDEPDDRFVEACHMKAYIEYLTDIFIVEDELCRIKAVELLQKDSKSQHLKDYVHRKRKEETRYVGEQKIA